MRYVKIYSLLSIYLFSCICLVINFHYCGGELEVVALYHADENNCCGENKSQKPDCCQDKYVFVDTDDNEKSTQYLIKHIDVVKNIADYPPSFVKIVDNDLVLEKMVIPIEHAPPNNSTTPSFIKNRMLLI